MPPKAADRLDLCERVAGWKRHFFGSARSDYEQARPGTFRLTPPSKHPALRRDYESTRDMCMTEPPRFDKGLATLAELEGRINGPVAE